MKQLLDVDTVAVLLVALVAVYLVKKLFDYSAKKSGIVEFRAFPAPLSVCISLFLFVALVIGFLIIPAGFSRVLRDCWFLRNVRAFSLLDLLLIFTWSVILAWFLARFQDGFWMYNGFGTKMYVSQSGDPNSGIGSKWLVALLVPVFPVRSYRVIGSRKVSWDHTEYATQELDSIQWDQVKETLYRSWWIYGLLALGILADITFSMFGCILG